MWKEKISVEIEDDNFLNKQTYTQYDKHEMQQDWLDFEVTKDKNISRPSKRGICRVLIVKVGPKVTQGLECWIRIQVNQLIGSDIDFDLIESNDRLIQH